MKQQRQRSKERGQSLVELALILPFLLLLLISVVEIGFAFRSYLITMAANREGVRFAARGRFSYDDVVERVISSGGTIGTIDGSTTFLRTEGDDPNTGIIITQIPIEADGTVLEAIRYAAGTLLGQPIQTNNSRTDITAVVDRNSASTIQINNIRANAGYEMLDNQIIILEVFYHHDSLWFYNFVGPLGESWTMYTQSSMRVVSDSRGGLDGGTEGD